MSRSGRIPINVPENAEVRIDNGIFYAKGSLGELEFNYKYKAKVEIKDNKITINPNDETKFASKMWGTVRSRV